jgi:hypothetical protein
MGESFDEFRHQKKYLRGIIDRNGCKRHTPIFHCWASSKMAGAPFEMRHESFMRGSALMEPSSRYRVGYLTFF